MNCARPRTLFIQDQMIFTKSSINRFRVSYSLDADDRKKGKKVLIFVGVVVFVSMSERKMEMFNTRVTEN